MEYPQIAFATEDQIRNFLSKHSNELHSLFSFAVKNALSESGGRKNVYISYLRTGILLNEDIFLITCTDENKLFDLNPCAFKISAPFINTYIYALVSEETVGSLLLKKATDAEVDFYRIDLFEQIAYMLFATLATIFYAQEYNLETDYVIYYGEYLGTYQPLTLVQSGE